ncbi:MAG: hypothetical protein SGJ11_17270 [Phycisphaerae bacterium]|nr:hypothetical protein [Phycisphaerae bacterium]
MTSYADIRDSFDTFLSERRRELFMALSAVLVALGASGAGYWWFVVRWQPPPSIFDAPVNDVLGYLAMDDFSQLPLKERMQFLLDFADRFRGMNQGDSAMMAGFLAGIGGPMREQLRQNARVLAKDILAEGAATYIDLPEAERAAFLDGWLAEWLKTAERMTTGEAGDAPDGERVQQFKDDAKKDATRQRDPNRVGRLTDKGASRFLDFWESDVQQASSPKEQGQITRFMDDMRKHVLK